MEIQEQAIAVELLGKEITVKCPEESQGKLQQIALRLQKRLQEVQESECVWSREDVLAIVALNFAHEYAELDQEFKSYKRYITKGAKAMTLIMDNTTDDNWDKEATPSDWKEDEGETETDTDTDTDADTTDTDTDTDTSE